MVKIITVHMMLSSQCYLKSGLLTQSFGQEDSRKLINTISSHCLPISKNILMDRPVLKQPEILSGMSCIQHPAQFPYGTRGTSVATLTSAILAPSQALSALI